MKILSYNLYGKKDVENPIPAFNVRLKNLDRIINNLVNNQDIDVICFQEVNENNMELVNEISKKNDYIILEKFPMKTRTINQYNIILIKNDNKIKINYVKCIPHGTDDEYKNIEEQIIDYGMSDYRTSVFVNLECNNNTYLVGNVHTDYISSEGIIKGMIKSLNYMDIVNANYKIILGDMNMVSHMNEARSILREKSNYEIVSKNLKKGIVENSYHGYGRNESVNVDFAFVEKDKKDLYDYEIIKQENIIDEGSDHRPIIITIN